MSLELSVPFRPVTCNVFVATRGTDKDLTLLDRFLRSLYASDFPKKSQVTIMGPAYGLDEARQLGSQLATRGAEWVLMSDTDIVVPKEWWVEMTKVLLAATPKPIGIVGPRFRGVPHQQDVRFTDNPQGPMFELGYYDSDFLPYHKKGDPIYLFDGFTLFRSNFLAETGLYPDAGIGWFVNLPQRTKWCVMIANNVVIDHNKG